jgi:hypothetical protein
LRPGTLTKFLNVTKPKLKLKPNEVNTEIMPLSGIKYRINKSLSHPSKDHLDYTVKQNKTKKSHQLNMYHG